MLRAHDLIRTGACHISFAPVGLLFRAPFAMVAFGGTMLGIRLILCPIDFSEFSVRAYRHALSLAEHYRARKTQDYQD
jgi:hypothetical protein